MGAMLGLAAGICLCVAQFLSGETVEERWSREYHYHQNLRDIEVGNWYPILISV